MTTPVFICLVIAAILLIILLSVLVIRQILKKAYEKAVVDYQNKLLSQEMAEVQHIYLTMRGWRHDYHNHMQSIKAYLAKDNIEEAREYLNKLETDLDDIRLLFDTGNLNADAILNAKISLALENGIPCDYSSFGFTSAPSKSSSTSRFPMQRMKSCGNLTPNTFPRNGATTGTASSGSMTQWKRTQGISTARMNRASS